MENLKRILYVIGTFSIVGFVTFLSRSVSVLTGKVPSHILWTIISKKLFSDFSEFNSNLNGFN